MIRPGKYNRHLRQKFIQVEVEFKGIPYQIIFFKNKKRGSKWHAIITTDGNISAQRAYKIYQTRWAIETSYKELKQTFGYGKCQSRDFDGQIADASQCLMCFNMLSHLKALENYQSIGALFAESSQQWLQPTLMQRFWKMLMDAIQELAELIGKPADMLIDLLINNSDFFRTISKLNLLVSAET